MSMTVLLVSVIMTLEVVVMLEFTSLEENVSLCNLYIFGSSYYLAAFIYLM